MNANRYGRIYHYEVAVRPRFVAALAVALILLCAFS